MLLLSHFSDEETEADEFKWFAQGCTSSKRLNRDLNSGLPAFVGYPPGYQHS